MVPIMARGTFIPNLSKTEYLGTEPGPREEDVLLIEFYPDTPSWLLARENGEIQLVEWSTVKLRLMLQGHVIPVSMPLTSA